MKKCLALALCLLLTLAACGTAEPVPTEVPTEATTEATTAPTTVPTTPPTEPQPESFLLTFVGDCTLGNGPGMTYVEGVFENVVGHDYDYPFQNVREYFENDDFTMINLEGVLGEEGYAQDKQFTFRGPSEYTQILTGSSVEAVTLANNHSRDFGHKGYLRTIELLEEAELTYVENNGTALHTTASGLTIGLIGCCFNYPKDMAEIVTELREAGAEVVVYAFHWGMEGAYYPLSHQVDQAHDAINCGVDIVYGHHPHVLQRIEEYNGGIIFYSLGNFCFGGNQQPQDLDTAILQQQVLRHPDGKVELGELTIIPASISSVPIKNNYQPTPYPEDSEEYQRVLEKLSGGYEGKRLYVSYG